MDNRKKSDDGTHADRDRSPDKMPQGPLGDTRPDIADQNMRTGGGQPQEKVEDRPNVGTVKPEDYPSQQ